MLDHVATLDKRTLEQHKLSPSPDVGISFVYDGRLLIEGTPVHDSQPYGTFKGHERGHPEFWRTLQQNRTVPAEVEYDEVPRGRDGYATKEGTFHIYLDPCILANQELANRIVTALNLPQAATAPPALNSHFKCPGCKKKSKSQLQQEEEDWDF